jgi:hypothetical protein
MSLRINAWFQTCLVAQFFPSAAMRPQATGFWESVGSAAGGNLAPTLTPGGTTVARSGDAAVVAFIDTTLYLYRQSALMDLVVLGAVGALTSGAHRASAFGPPWCRDSRSNRRFSRWSGGNDLAGIKVRAGEGQYSIASLKRRGKRVRHALSGTQRRSNGRPVWNKSLGSAGMTPNHFFQLVAYSGRFTGFSLAVGAFSP